MKQEIWSYDLYEDGLCQVGLIDNSEHIQGKWVKLEDIQDSICKAELIIGSKDEVISKLKLENEKLADRRNTLIAEKATVVSALWNLVQNLPPSLQCADFPSHDGDAHFGPCPKVGKYMEHKERAEELINQFIRKPKA